MSFNKTDKEILEDNKVEILGLINEGWGVPRIAKKFHFSKSGTSFLKKYLKQHLIKYNLNDKLTESECEFIDSVSNLLPLGIIAQKLYRETDMIKLYLDRKTLNPEGYEFYNYNEWYTFNRLRELPGKIILNVRCYYRDNLNYSLLKDKFPEFSMDFLKELTVGININKGSFTKIAKVVSNVWKKYDELDIEQKQLPLDQIANLIYENCHKTYRFYLIYKYLRLLLIMELQDFVVVDYFDLETQEDEQLEYNMKLDAPETNNGNITISPQKLDNLKIIDSTIITQNFDVEGFINGQIDYNSNLVIISFTNGNRIELTLEDFQKFIVFINHMKDMIL